MAAVTTDSEEKICFRFNQGLCKNKNYKYVHKIMSEQQKKEDKDIKDSNKKTKIDNKNKLKNSMKNNNSSATNGMHNPTSLSAIVSLLT